ncbi:hypothetical protein KOW79_012770 [Hemibagrus wyckioides]|uniref:Uncharacterized protein n=1 Tax=Hemibagrus wyckioides TaxID=337641 RepID=A0A9D3NKV8_9TELE|nr:hypothetical protein KOW79_012770 [Hemibagrus wyckioides]
MDGCNVRIHAAQHRRGRKQHEGETARNRCLNFPGDYACGLVRRGHSLDRDTIKEIIRKLTTDLYPPIPLDSCLMKIHRLEYISYKLCRTKAYNLYSGVMSEDEVKGGICSGL